MDVYMYMHHVGENKGYDEIECYCVNVAHCIDLVNMPMCGEESHENQLSKQLYYENGVASGMPPSIISAETLVFSCIKTTDPSIPQGHHGHCEPDPKYLLVSRRPIYKLHACRIMKLRGFGQASLYNISRQASLQCSQKLQIPAFLGAPFRFLTTPPVTVNWIQNTHWCPGAPPTDSLFLGESEQHGPSVA